MPEVPGLEAGLQRIREDRTRGAAELALAGLTLLARVPAEQAGWAARDLASCRPAMAPLANAAAWFLEAGGGPAAARAARRRLEVDLRSLTVEASRRLVPFGHVVTLSRSSTVRAALKDFPGRVTVLESRPDLEGRRLVVDLRRGGVAADLATEAQAARATADAGVVLLGADAVTQDLALWNRVGSMPLALVAQDAGVPVWALADASKCQGRLAARDMPDEDRGGKAVWPRHPQWCSDPVFEAVPERLIGAWMTEQGPMRPEGMRRRLRRARALWEAHL